MNRQHLHLGLSHSLGRLSCRPFSKIVMFLFPDCCSFAGTAVHIRRAKQGLFMFELGFLDSGVYSGFRSRWHNLAGAPIAVVFRDSMAQPPKISCIIPKHSMGLLYLPSSWGG